MDEIMPLLIRHLCDQTTLTDLLGRNPFKVFPGTVPAKVEGLEIKPPWVTLERGGWSEEMTFSGGTGDYTCPTSIVVVATTAALASQIYSAIHTVLNGKNNVLWSERLGVQECTLTDGRQVPLLEADGSLSSLQQIVGDMLLFCEVLPLST